MSHTPHELAEEFSAQLDIIQALNSCDSHFRHLAERYHEINRAVHRAETNVAPTGQFYQEAMRKERMRLKDEIAHIISVAA